VDESAEKIPTLQAIGGVQWRRVAAIGRREELECAVRPVLVVMAAIDAEDVLEVPGLVCEPYARSQQRVMNRDWCVQPDAPIHRFAGETEFCAPHAANHRRLRPTSDSAFRDSH
jgi:hypothetical protein